MSLQRYRNDNPRDADEIANAIEFELQQIDESYPVVVGTQNYAYINSFATTLAEQQEAALADLYDAAFVLDASGDELTKRAREIGVIRQDAVGATGVAEFTTDGAVTQDRGIPSGTRISTGGDDSVTFRTTEQAVIDGPYTDTDTTNYTTTSTTYVSKASFTVDADYRDSVDVNAEIAISDGNHSAELRVQDTDNGNTIATYSTQNTSLTAVGPDSYDLSSITGDITIEFQLSTTDSSATAELQDSEIDVVGKTGALANIRCTETGPDGNVGAQTINSFIDQPAGVDDVTNPDPTGNRDYTLTDGTTKLTVGAEEEDDPSLRERALDSTAIGGAGTADATELALENLEEVISADVFTNRTDTASNNVDPWYTEVRVYGGNVDDIGQELYDVLPLGTLKTLVGGANGTQEQTTITTDIYGDLVIPITRPTILELAIDIDVVHTNEYSGDDAVKDAIVDYIGGTTTDARSITGLKQGENVLVNIVENVTEDVAGVDYADVTMLDSNNDGSDDTTTDGDGVPVLTVSDSEVATVDAADITISTTLH